MGAKKFGSSLRIKLRFDTVKSSGATYKQSKYAFYQSRVAGGNAIKRETKRKSL